MLTRNSGMKILLNAIAVLFVIASVSIPPTTLAWGSKSKKSAPAAATDTSDKITSLHLTSIIVTVNSTHAAKEYKVTPATKITVNGQPSTLSSLSTGMDVNISTANDPTVAATIDARSAQRK
jgi:hypothetical protein